MSTTGTASRSGGRRQWRLSRRRGIHLLALATAAGLALTGCTTSPTNAKGPTPISVFGIAEPGVKDYNTNDFTNLVNEKFDMKLSFQTVAVSDVAQKQPVLLASGDYPDVIFNGQLTTNDTLKYGQQGVFVDLKPLLQKDAPNVWQQIQSTPGLEKSITAPDGKIYALPPNNYCLHCNWTYQQWINIKDLDKYGLTMPKTTADYEHVLSVFKQNGLVPLTGATDGYATDPFTFLMNAFIPLNSTITGSVSGNAFLGVVNGKVQLSATQPAWRDGLRYLNGLYKKGYFSSSALTQNTTQAQQAISQGKVGVIPAGAITAVLPGSMTSQFADWLPIPALTGPNGVQSAAFTGQPAQGRFAITNKASSAATKKILELLNYMWTPDGSMTLNYGAKGKYWDDAPKGSKGLVDKQALFKTINPEELQGAAVQNVEWNQFGPFDTNEVVRNQVLSPNPFDSTGQEAYFQLTTQVAMSGHQAPEVYPAYAWVPSSELASYATQQTNVNNYVVQNTEQFITGAKSLDSDWDSYVADLNKLGVSDYLAASQKAMTAPFPTTDAQYKPDESNIAFLLCKGPVPTLDKKYLIQSGVPEASFSCTK